MQYEPARKLEDGTCCRDNAISITTKQEEVENHEFESDTLQMDATYLAINLPFIPDEKRDKFNMDTTDDKGLWSYQKPGFLSGFL